MNIGFGRDVTERNRVHTPFSEKYRGQASSTARRTSSGPAGDPARRRGPGRRTRSSSEGVMPLISLRFASHPRIARNRRPRRPRRHQPGTSLPAARRLPLSSSRTSQLTSNAARHRTTACPAVSVSTEPPISKRCSPRPRRPVGIPICRSALRRGRQNTCTERRVPCQSQVPAVGTSVIDLVAWRHWAEETALIGLIWVRMLE